MRRRALWGVAAAAAYVAVALLLPGRPIRPLFDITTPQPYQWVNPPAIYAPGNIPPKPSTHTLELIATGSVAASFATSDGQAAIVLKEKTFAPRAGEKQVTITIAPLDPATVGPPPRGQRYDGNAYRFTALYARSRVEAALTQPATVVLRFPIVATKLLRRDADRWTDLMANPVSASLQIFSDATKLDVFVAVGPPLHTPAPEKKFPVALVISIAAAVVAVGAGLYARLRGRKRRRMAKKPRPRPKGPPSRGAGSERG